MIYLFIWIHGEKLASFVECMNRYHQTINFPFESYRNSVSFLDVLVSRNGHVLETDLFCKPTDTHQYLQRSSCHPWHIEKAIPYGQALRLRRICSDEDVFRTRSENLVEWLVYRGYSENFVREQVACTSHLNREVLIKQENRRSESSKERIPVVAKSSKDGGYIPSST